MPTGRASTLVPSLRRAVLAREAADRGDADLVAAFVRDRDADAFAELVRRHGPMVLGVCRRITGDHHTADDAFQAVFLVLARRAAAVRPRAAVGGWLYGVAYRTAAKAKAGLIRRRTREKQVEAMPEPPAPSPPADLWSDVRPVIDEELARLPERLRLAVVLCDLEGRPQRQVAKNLGIPQPTLATRLASARRLLAGRLTRRGVALSGGALAALLSGHAAAAVAPRAADGLARAAEAIATGTPVCPLVSDHAVQLSEGMMRMMLLAKLRAVGAAALATLALTTGLGVGLTPARADDTKPATAAGKPAAPKPPAPTDDAAFFRRVCLDLRGTPPTPVETGYFAADRDAAKRRKVVDWLLTDDAVKAYVAKKAGVPAERVRALTLKNALTIALELTGPTGIAVSPDGKHVAVEGKAALLLSRSADLSGTLTLNDVHYDVIRLPLAQSQLATHALSADRIAVALDLGLPVVLDSGAIEVAGDDPVAVQGIKLGTTPNDPVQVQGGTITVGMKYVDRFAEPDADFLRRAVQSARGTAPSAVEEKYFAADTDPKKREKLLDLLLKDPAVAKKVGADWKKQMLLSRPTTLQVQGIAFNDIAVAQGRQLMVRAMVANDARAEKLVGELLGAKKPDDQVLDGLTLALLGRLPTDAEKSLALAAVGKAADKKAAWVEVATTLAATAEAKAHAKPPEKK